MIGTLKQEIEAKIGFRIEDRGHCQFLADAIYEELDESVSYNTIRRFFGLAKGGTQSKTTLNILARFIGYPSYPKFCKAMPEENEWSVDNKIYSLISSRTTDETIDFLVSARLKDQRFLQTFIRVVRELILLKELKLVGAIFSRKALLLDKLSYSEMIQVGNGLGIIFRSTTLPERELIKLLKNNNFRQLVLLTFVDYSSLSAQYGRMIMLARKANLKLNANDKAFFTCINYLRAYLLKEKNADLPLTFSKIKNQHPILSGRIASVQIEEKRRKGESYKDILDRIHNQIKSTKVRKLDFLYELKTTSLLFRNFQLMKWISDFDFHELIEEHYQVTHAQSHYLTMFILAIKENDLELAASYQSRIDKGKWVLSYFEFYAIFYNIGVYHITTERAAKLAILKDIEQNIQHLNYPHLNKKYALDYFADLANKPNA